MALATLSIDLEAKLANLERDFSKASRIAEQNAQKMQSAFGNVGKAVGGIFAAALAAGAVDQFKGMVNYLDQMDEAAERIGSSASDLSALAYAAKLSGVEFEDLNKGLVKFSGTLADAAGGNKDAIALLNKLGVSAGNYDDLNAALSQTADKFSTLKDGVGKTALASDAFGEKLGAKMVPLLNQGSEGMAAMRQEAEKLGGIIDDKLAKQAADFNDNLDRLKTVAGSLGKALANDLLPTLNELSVEFIEGMKNSDGFFDALMKYGLTNPFKDHATKLIELRNEFEQLDFKLSNGRSKDEEADKKSLRSLEQQISYYDKINKLQSGESAPDKPRTGVVSKGSTGNEKAKKEATFTDYQATLTERISKAIEQTDVVKADELAAAIAKLDQLAAAGLDPAIVKAVRDDLTGATKTAAEELNRLNALLGATDSGKIEEAAKDMQLLTKALEEGRISEEQYLEAVQTRLDSNTEKIKEQKSLAEELGLTFSSAFEDAIANGGNFSSVLKGLEQDILRVIMRLTVTEPLLKAFKDEGGASGIASAIGSWFSSSSSTATPTPNAKGGVYSSPSLSAYSGGVYSTPQLFQFANGAGVFGEAGPEAIMPLKRGKDGKLGVAGGGGDVTVNVINNTSAQATTSERSDAKGNKLIEVIIEQAKNAVAGDIASGNGAVPAALASTFGLSRKAGAY